MPRKPRIEQIGYHHIINRGVAKTITFFDDEDYEKFLSFVSTAKSHYGLTLHSFCLMPNHYHLLIETFNDNLSLIMRQINSQYAQYFNKKYDRIGPLWQGRFKSYYVYDDKYLNVLLRYIEQNPVKAGIVKDVAIYCYSSSFFIANNKDKDLLKGSLLGNFGNIKTLGKELNDKEKEDLVNLEKTKFIADETKIKRAKEKSLEEYFKKDMTKQKRDENILIAIKDGYKQSEIAEFLKLTRASISIILSKNKGDKLGVVSLYILDSTDKLFDGFKGMYNVNKFKILIIKTEQNLFAIEDKCGHFSISLKDADIINNTIRCNAHGILFSLINGEKLNNPYDEADAIKIFKIGYSEDKKYFGVYL